MPTFQTFKDLSVTFKKHPVTDDLVQVQDKAAIVQAIQGILLTRKGERPFQPELGCDVQNMLFEPLDYASAGTIKQEIQETIDRYEPRVTVGKITCKPDFDNNGYNVQMQYTIVGRNDVPIGVEFILERTR